jgi:hypothetical protein
MVFGYEVYRRLSRDRRLDVTCVEHVGLPIHPAYRARAVNGALRLEPWDPTDGRELRTDEVVFQVRWAEHTWTRKGDGSLGTGRLAFLFLSAGDGSSGRPRAAEHAAVKAVLMAANLYRRDADDVIVRFGAGTITVRRARA